MASGRRDDTLGVIAAEYILTEGNAGARLAVLLKTGQASAPGGVFFRFAVCIGSARQCLARIDASALDAS